jgi:hypothetical protein
MPNCPALGSKCDFSHMPVGPAGHRACEDCQKDLHACCGVEDSTDIHCIIFTCLACLEKPNHTGTTARGVRMGQHAKKTSHGVVPSGRGKNRRFASSTQPSAASTGAAAAAIRSESQQPKTKKRKSGSVTSTSEKDDLRQIYSHFSELSGKYRGVNGTGKEQNHPPCECIYCDQAYQDAKAKSTPGVTLVSGALPHRLPNVATVLSTTYSFFSFFPNL